MTSKSKFNQIYIGILLGFSVSACSIVTPKPIANAELVAQGKADLVAARQNVDPITGDLTLDEALARALKYNLDRRAKMMEEALAFNQLEVTQLDMLPKLLAQAGYSSRDNDRISQSRDSSSGSLVTSRFISQERSHTLYDLGLSWSLLDLGVGYIASQQQADRLLIAGEKRRKAMHVMMQDVRTAFWRSASAQKLRDQVRATIAVAEEAMADSRQAETMRIRNPIDSLRYQRQVLENLRLLEAIDQELSAAHIELASLINAPLGLPFRVAEPAIKPDKEALAASPEVMEEMAMAENADIREQHYNVRIASQETRKTLLRLFPNITFTYGFKYDTDSYLVNKQWNETGVQLSFNLLNLLTAPTQLRLAESGLTLSEQRRMTVQMAVLTQVHLARQQFANSISQFERADAIWQTDNRIVEHMVNREAVQAQSKLDRVSNQTAAILSLLRRYQAMAQVHAAEARLQATLGLEPKIDSVGSLSLAELAKQVAATQSVSATVNARQVAEAKAAAEARAAAEAKAAAKAAEKEKLEDDRRALIIPTPDDAIAQPLAELRHEPGAVPESEASAESPSSLLLGWVSR